MPTTKKKSSSQKRARIKAPVNWSGCRCMTCGKLYNTRAGYFSKTQSPWFKGNDGFIPICKDCVTDMFNYYSKKYGDEDEAILRIAMFFDWFYSDELMEIAEKSKNEFPKIGTYIGRLNMRQNINKTFDTYLDEKHKQELSALPSKDMKSKVVTAKMVKTWGQGLSDDDYFFLEDEYKSWSTRHECKTKAQEESFKALAMAQLNFRKANMTGDSRKIKDAFDVLQSAMGTAYVKPSQTTDNGLAENNTFGTLIQKWEETEPISDPSPTWVDPDHIRKYIRVWVLGTVLKMFNIKNPYQQEYDEEMEKYTVTKPEYSDDEDNVDSIRNRIFGNGGEDE